MIPVKPFSTQYQLTMLINRIWAPMQRAVFNGLCPARRLPSLPRGFAPARQLPQSQWGSAFPSRWLTPCNRFKKQQSCHCDGCACYFSNRPFCCPSSRVRFLKPIYKMGHARLYWRTHPFSKVSESTPTEPPEAP